MSRASDIPVIRASDTFMSFRKLIFSSCQIVPWTISWTEASCHTADVETNYCTGGCAVSTLAFHCNVTKWDGLDVNSHFEGLTR